MFFLILLVCCEQRAHTCRAVTETGWYNSYEQSVGMEGWRPFRKNRHWRQGGGVTFHVSDRLECTELSLGMDEESIKSLWVRIKGRAGTGDRGDLLHVTQPGRLSG